MTGFRSLDRAFEAAGRIPFDIKGGRYVVMSDYHVGDGERWSDDFRRNKAACLTALHRYFEYGYCLINLGDIEELWECDFPDVQRAYGELYDIEKRFFEAGRLYRVFGNHDIFWKNTDYLLRFLRPVFPGIIIHEALRLEAPEGTIFLTHGHQGELFSHRLWRFSRFVVRRIWRPIQRLIRIPSTGAAHNIKKRNQRELEYYRWASARRLLFIAGHTHRAMFASLSEIDRLRASLDALISRHDTPDISNAVKTKEDELRAEISKQFADQPEPLFQLEGEPSPCYFNDGCCSYTTGLTAIEIDQGRIRLVKWDRNTSLRTVYEEEDLLSLFKKIRLVA